MSEEKMFMIRMPHKMWEFLKKQSIKQGKPVSEIVRNLIEENKKKLEKKY
jgi:predicted DNA-binding protein